ncbi:MAG TPA: polymer-forming cytoskeletal protein [Prolixibacteraceae bacterium]|jgi:cytoskeletal protein CcmA (bactofilin family)
MLKRVQSSIQTTGDNLKIPTLINDFSQITGELVLNTDLRVDGKIFGKVESDKNIFIGTQGFVKGTLKANNLVAYGRIEGNIIVSGITILHPGSYILGSLYTKVINVIEGANISANVMSFDNLEQIEEAKISLAENISMAQLNEESIPLYPTENINNKDQAAKKDPETVYSRDKEKPVKEEVQSPLSGEEHIVSKQAEPAPKPPIPEPVTDNAFVHRQNNEAGSKKSVLFESLLRHPVAENIGLLNVEIERLNQEAAKYQPQTESKSKIHPAAPFKGIMNLLGQIKEVDAQS